MSAIVFITLVSFISSDSLVKGSATENAPDNGSNRNEWSFGFTNIPTFGWLYDRIYTPAQLESSTQSESGSMKSQSEKISQNSDEQHIAKLVIDPNESLDEHKSAKKVDDILEMIDKSSDEEKKQYMPFLESLQNTLTNNPKRFAKVLLKDMWHVVDLGIFNTSERRRNVENTKSLIDKIIDFFKGIYNAIYNYIADRIRAGKRGAQKGWAAYERKQEGDNREWNEEEATARLHEMESHYKTMNKEELTKDLISLSMQPLFSVKYYEEIIRFMDKLRAEDIIDKAILDKAFKLVDYKGDFAKTHKIGIEETEDEKHRHEAEKHLHEDEKHLHEDEKHRHEAEKPKHEAEKEKHDKEKEKHAVEKVEHKG